MRALSVPNDIRSKQVSLFNRVHGPAPDCYQAIAEWWRLEAMISKNPALCHWYADNQYRLAIDMEARPDHYKIKPENMTDWQWSALTPSKMEDVSA